MVAVLGDDDRHRSRAAVQPHGVGAVSRRGQLEALFEAEWERAVAIDGGKLPSTPREDEPDDIARSLVMLLMTGMSDTAIARAEGWSLRTTHRRLQRVMVDLGATTRFQAGVLAARRGWI